MEEQDKILSELTGSEYKYGFTTDIETEMIPKGLDEEVVRLISAKKGEPEWMLEYRLKAFRHWKTMTMPRWPHLDLPEIDFEDIIYYAAPKPKPKLNSLDEIDPELKATFDKLGVPLEEQMIMSGGLGTMGYGLPGGIGAKIGNPDRPVIVISGDGGVQMNIQELATAVLEELPIICCIFNNEYLGMVRQWQTLFYKQHYSATVLDDGVDYVKIAEAMGTAARRVTTQEEFNAAFQEALESKTPFVIDAIVDSDDK